METAALITFFVTLLLVFVLFALKRVEVARGRRFGEGVRSSADRGALRVKEILQATEGQIENIPWFLGAITRYGVHVGAMSFARLARVSEREAQRLAEMVSHRHRFERKETKSKYLKEVSGYREEGDDGVASK